MSVNQATADNDVTADTPPEAKAAKADRTDMVGKALGLLVLLGDEPRGASAAEISRRAELPFSTTYRLLGSLTRDGFVDYEPDGRRYHLGLRIFQLGQRVSNHHGFAGTAMPVLRRVTEQTGEATILSVRDGHHHLTVNKVDGPQMFRVTSDPGHLGSLSTTAVGKVLVAFAEDADRERLLEDLPLEQLTEKSITERDAFRAEIDKVRRQGYAVMDEENEMGMRAVAVPLLNSQGHAFASLATAVPVFRMGLEELAACVPLLQEAAAELAARLPQR
ncbi:IclR family transcriptional regulator [Pseudarthrobacter oxydans]|jgi:DNA-binding IclR family transcriptional regulator|uniref:DNA-binding IclR family transcriptional regulator n=1 Tax=Pseudarthrobacter oxydans TaxID=1671 RepID=A0AAW8ND15_PSEOX|nr:IclR family transcriptional regulator [Pseudarthrobacter oxydans]MDV2980401.1 IclR family transcriptional regulator [Actinomycetes bacterium ARC8]WHP59319.1 IclR family transcriptional regulator [Arthrobacter sp. KFRI-F3372]MDR6793569.1 DNA-binding IclR family transcriptional regulator [Pseudarthrobacter oxydans]MDR7164615.1 DNA-binding IclR family transcriptional regulator [Pseudarthrobacter oxydans]BFE43778.1 DNA-binding transcriptional regulator KdgR [Pseudarthrobacter oxydans]